MGMFVQPLLKLAFAYPHVPQYPCAGHHLLLSQMGDEQAASYPQ
jgi:hypothetical protein